VSFIQQYQQINVHYLALKSISVERQAMPIVLYILPWQYSENRGFLFKRKGRTCRQNIVKSSNGKILLDANGTHSHNQLDPRKRCVRTVSCDSSLRPAIRKEWSNLWTYRSLYCPFYWGTKGRNDLHTNSFRGIAQNKLQCRNVVTVLICMIQYLRIAI
jgi:hypothetical protein